MLFGEKKNDHGNHWPKIYAECIMGHCMLKFQPECPGHFNKTKPPIFSEFIIVLLVCFFFFYTRWWGCNF